MDLRQLRYFKEVVEVGSFLGASERLDTAQPSLWRQVKALEKELGVVLFERSGRRVRATSAGLVLLPLAEQVLVGADKMKALATELMHGRAGIVTIECAHPHLLTFLAPLIGGFHVVRPEVQVAIHGLPGLPSIDRVIGGEADFVTSVPCADRRLDGLELGQARIVVVTPDEHPWRRHPTVDVTELAGTSVLLGPSSSLTRSLLEPALRTRGIRLDIVYESLDIASLTALARAGLGVAVVAEDHLPGESAGRNWPELRDGESTMATAVWIYWSSERALSPPVAEFADYVKRSISP
jgi:DNA-binding transcriptional LysR family regulator